MGTAAQASAPDQAVAVRQVRRAQGSQPGIRGASATRGGPRSCPGSAQLIGLCPGCMYLVTDRPPEVGRRVVARFSLRGEPIGGAAGYVIGRIAPHGITIGFHHVSPRVRELIDDLQMLRPALRPGFLRLLIDAHVSVT